MGVKRVPGSDGTRLNTPCHPDGKGQRSPVAFPKTAERRPRHQGSNGCLLLCHGCARPAPRWCAGRTRRNSVPQHGPRDEDAWTTACQSLCPVFGSAAMRRRGGEARFWMSPAAGGRTRCRQACRACVFARSFHGRARPLQPHQRWAETRVGGARPGTGRVRAVQHPRADGILLVRRAIRPRPPGRRGHDHGTGRIRAAVRPAERARCRPTPCPDAGPEASRWSRRPRRMSAAGTHPPSRGDGGRGSPGASAACSRGAAGGPGSHAPRER